MNLKGFFVNIVCNKVRKWHANIPNTGVCSLMVHLALLGKHEIVGGFFVCFCSNRASNFLRGLVGKLLFLFIFLKKEKIVWKYRARRRK